MQDLMWKLNGNAGQQTSKAVRVASGFTARRLNSCRNPPYVPEESRRGREDEAGGTLICRYHCEVTQASHEVGKARGGVVINLVRYEHMVFGSIDGITRTCSIKGLAYAANRKIGSKACFELVFG
jgi:hypothetical protein